MLPATNHTPDVIGIPLTKYAPQVLQLGEGLTGEVAEASYRKMGEQYGKHPYLTGGAPKKGQPMRRLNPFKRFSIAHIVEQEGGKDYRLVTPPVAEEAVAVAFDAYARGDDRLLKKLKGFFEDLGIAVYGAPGPNEELRQHLLPQLRARGFNPEQAPVVVYRAFTIKNDKFQESLGLGFNLPHEENVAFYAPVLLETTSNFRSDSPNLVVEGLPNTNELDEGGRQNFIHAC